MRALWFVVLSTSIVTACSVAPATEEEGEEIDAAEAEQELGADRLALRVIDADVAPGTLEGRYARVLTDGASARALLGGAMPPVTFSRNWLVAYRPADKTPTSRVVLTRAQLSASGKTMSLWATITEPGAGCAPWWPNELAVGRVPSRATKPTSVRVYVTRETAACGRGEPYSGTSESCADDAACGAGGICAGLSTSQEGLCQAAWMRGTYSMPESGQYSAPLPQGGEWQRLIVPVSGQATVPMDAWVQVFADGIPPARVEWRVTNPDGTSSTIVRGTTFGGHHPVWVPGDESVNGEWVVEVRDVGAGPTGYLRGVRLSLTSRWD